jgi:N-acetylglucosamine malate deacetylase 2
MTETDELLRGFLAALPGEGSDSSRIAVIVAHPDDETIGIGGHLRALRGIQVIHVTDGAPADMADASAHGMTTREEYAAARRSELDAAMALAGVSPSRRRSFDVIDQQAAHVLPDLVRGLAALFGSLSLDIVLTHPFEGGHPDHDATCFAVHAAAALCRRAGAGPPILVEMAFYHEAEGRLATQRFPASDGTDESCFMLDSTRWRRKQRMLAAFATQQRSLASFSDRCERLRVAPAYDFTELPNNGRLYYEHFPWGMTGRVWQQCAAASLAELRLQGRL